MAQLQRALDELNFEIEAWRAGLAAGVKFYGNNNSSVAKQVAEDERQAAAIDAEIARRLQDKDNTYR